jgi:non-heme chloroperoxidase
MEQIAQTNTTGRRPVVFIHDRWLLPSSWDRSVQVFEDHGYAPLAAGWPDDPDTIEAAKAHPELFANKTQWDRSPTIWPLSSSGWT